VYAPKASYDRRSTCSWFEDWRIDVACSIAWSYLEDPELWKIRVPRTVILLHAGSRLVLLSSSRNPAETDVRGTELEFPVTQAGSSARTLPDHEAVWRKCLRVFLLYKEHVKLVCSLACQLFWLYESSCALFFCDTSYTDRWFDGNSC